MNLRSYNSTTDEYTASVDVRRGYDGNIIWSQSTTGDGIHNTSMWAYSCDDLDGDGRDDVFIDSESYDSGTCETTCTVYAKRGYDGVELWSHSIAGEGVWVETDYYNWYCGIRTSMVTTCTIH